MNDPANLHNDEAGCLGERLASRNGRARVCATRSGGFLSRGADRQERVDTVSHFTCLSGPMLHQACCPPESFHPSCTALFTCSRLCLWWRGTLAVALGAYLPSDLSSLRQNPRGKRWLLLWELLGDQCPGDGVAADNNLCSSSSSSNFQHLLKHILPYFCHTLVSSEDRSLNKLLWLWQSPEELQTPLTFIPDGPQDRH